MSEYYLQGAQLLKRGSGFTFSVESLFFGGAASIEPEKITVNWLLLRSEPFPTREEAWHFLHANAERFIREGIRVARLLEVVEYRQPQIIAMFPEITRESALQIVRPPRSLSAQDPDAWKQGGDA